MTDPGQHASQSRTTSWRQYLRWAVFIGIATFTQLAFKQASAGLGDGEFGIGYVMKALIMPWVLLAITGYIAMFVAWMQILKSTPLSKAYPITAIVFVPVTIGAWALFGEHISYLRGIGIAAITVGVALSGDDATGE